MIASFRSHFPIFNASLGYLVRTLLKKNKQQKQTNKQRFPSQSSLSFKKLHELRSGISFSSSYSVLEVRHLKGGLTGQAVTSPLLRQPLFLHPQFWAGLFVSISKDYPLVFHCFDGTSAEMPTFAFSSPRCSIFHSAANRLLVLALLIHCLDGIYFNLPHFLNFMKMRL